MGIKLRVIALSFAVLNLIYCRAAFAYAAETPPTESVNATTLISLDGACPQIAPIIEGGELPQPFSIPKASEWNGDLASLTDFPLHDWSLGGGSDLGAMFDLDLQENERLGCIEVMDQNGSRELGAQASATFSNGQVRAANLPPSFYRTLRALPFGVQKTVIFHVVNSQLEIIRNHAYRFRTLPPLGIVARNPGSSRLDMGSGPEVQIANGMNGMNGNSFAANGCSSTHTASESSRLSFILTLSLSFILLFRMRKNTIRG